MERKKKIAYLTNDCFFDTDSTILPFLNEKYDLLWINIVSYNNHKDEYIYKDFSLKHNIKTLIIKNTLRQRSLNNFCIYTRIAKVLKKEKIDIIFIVEMNLYAIFPFYFLFGKSNIILAIHDSEPHSNIKFRNLIKVEKKLRSLMYQHFVFYSQYQLEVFKKSYHKDGYLVGMSNKNFGISNKKPPIWGNEIKLLFFGNIHYYKGLDILIEAIEELYTDGYNNISLSIYGKGVYWQECMKNIKHKELYNLNVRYIENEEIPDIMCSHHFLVLPYRDVTQSGPLMIAVNYGLPIIAPNIGCFKDIYSSDTAILYEPGHLKDALFKVSKLSKANYLNYRNNASSITKMYYAPQIAKNYISIFDHIIRTL